MTAKTHIPALVAWALLQSAAACDTGDVCIAVRPCDNAQNIGTMDRKLDELRAALNSLKEQNADSYGMTFDGGAGVCYYLSNGTNTWDLARQDCINRQSDLIIINSQEKQDLLLSVSGTQDVWIGMTDRETEGVWKWVDGTPLTTPTFWLTGQPDNGSGTEHCAHLWTTQNAVGWNDDQCYNSAYWMCERAV